MPGHYTKALKKKKKDIKIESSLTVKDSSKKRGRFSRKKSDVESVMRSSDGKNTLTVKDSDKKRGRFHLTKSTTSKNGKKVHSKKSISVRGRKGKFHTIGYETYTDDKGKKKRRLTRR